MRPIALLAGLLVVVGVFVAGAFAADRRREAEELLALQEDVQAARSAVQTCQGDVAAREASFKQFDLRLNSLRERVGDLETLEGPGVPAEQYEEYLELFGAYNDSVQVWESLSDGLRAREARCRRLVLEHNALVDALSARLEARE